MEELKPCPACGAPVNIAGGDEWHNQHEFWICCENKECGCVRVGDTEREECIRRWNDLPRALNWMKEPPTKEGFYWLRNKQVVSVVEVWIDSRGEIVVFSPGDEVEKESWEIPDAEWAGPLLKPYGEENG